MAERSPFLRVCGLALRRQGSWFQIHIQGERPVPGFTGPLIVREINEYTKIIEEPFSFIRPNGDSIDIPKYYTTDFASIPRLFWNLLPPDGCYAQAAVVHDFCYQFHKYPRKECDMVLLEGMTVLKVPGWKKWVIYQNVRAFGWMFY